jgi:hypothetical protein
MLASAWLNTLLNECQLCHKGLRLCQGALANLGKAVVLPRQQMTPLAYCLLPSVIPGGMQLRVLAVLHACSLPGGKIL